MAKISSPEPSRLTAWGTHPHNYNPVSLMLHVKTQIFLGTCSHKTFRNSSTPLLCFFLHLCQILRCPIMLLPFWKTEPLYRRSGCGRSGFPSNSNQMRAGPFLLLLLGGGAWGAAGTLSSHQHRYGSWRDSVDANYSSCSLACGWHLTTGCCHAGQYTSNYNRAT